jgi:predicted permease
VTRPGSKRRFRFSFRTREDVRSDIHDEFAFHLEMRTEALIDAGLDRASARAQALEEFGNRDAGAAGCARYDDGVERAGRLTRWLGEVRQDARVGLRLLARSPGFAVVAVLTLALGIGANAAIYSALDAVLLRPLPYPAPDRLVQVVEIQNEGLPNSVSGGAFLDWRAHQRQFDGLTLTDRVSLNVRGSFGPERLRGMMVTHEFFAVFGIRPFLGRAFLPEDDRPGGTNDVVILTEELWRSRFGGDASLLGRPVVLDEVPRTVVGIVPGGAWMFKDDQFLIPAVLDPVTPSGQRSPHWAVVFGRLKAEATVAQAETDLKDVKERLNAAYPAFKQRWSVGVRALQDQLAADTRPFLFILLGAAALVLLIACANVATLLLARAHTREQELALRAALGASGSRITRQVLTESVVLAAIGGAAGLLVAFWSVGVLQSLTADMLPRALAPRLDLRVLAVSLALTGFTGLLFGSLPAWRARRTHLNETLKNGGKNATVGGRHRTQRLLIVGEVALTVILLAGAGLLLRSLANVTSTDPGFEPDRVLAFDLSLPRATYRTSEQRLAFSRTLLTRIRALPGVDAAGAGVAIPFSGRGSGEYFRRTDRPRELVLGRLDFASDGYLDALGARLLAGRFFTPFDNRIDGPRVLVINQTAARTFFPDEEAVGRQINVAANTWTVVGVVANVADRRLDAAPRPFAYAPQVFDPSGLSVAVRTPLDPLALTSAIRGEIQRLDSGVPLDNVRALSDALGRSLDQRRLVLNLMAIFALTALLLASIGLYGVMAYSVASRRRELCIRMALGAMRRDVMRGVLGEGARLVVIGLVIGLAGALAATRPLTVQLYRVETYDPVVLAGTTIVLATVALIACWTPAHRATRLNPIAALRND